jgi:hypothetical protein
MRAVEATPADLTRQTIQRLARRIRRMIGFGPRSTPEDIVHGLGGTIEYSDNLNWIDLDGGGIDVQGPGDFNAGTGSIYSRS